jgi:hypothetical protein
MFSNNSAANAGGAVKWDDLEPLNIMSNIFSSNKAGLYGNNVASFA